MIKKKMCVWKFQQACLASVCTLWLQTLHFACENSPKMISPGAYCKHDSQVSWWLSGVTSLDPNQKKTFKLVNSNRVQSTSTKYFPCHWLSNCSCLLFAGESAWEWREHCRSWELPRQSAEYREVADDHEAEAGVLPQPLSRVEHRGPPAWSWGVCVCVSVWGHYSQSLSI